MPNDSNSIGNNPRSRTGPWIAIGAGAGTSLGSALRRPEWIAFGAALGTAMGALTGKPDSK